MENKNKRCRNFTELEKTLIVDLVTDHCVIENKRTDGVTVKKKKKAWELVAQQYNFQATTGPRTVKQLHALYDILKKNERRNTLDDKKILLKTGGGTFVAKTTSHDEKKVPQFRSLPARFDSSTDSRPPSISSVINDNKLAENSCPPSTSSVFNDKKIAEKILPEEKTFIDDLTNRIIKRQNQTDDWDEVIKNKKMAILDIEEKIKLKQLELISQQVSQEKILFELQCEIKKKELNKII